MGNGNHATATWSCDYTDRDACVVAGGSWTGGDDGFTCVMPPPKESNPTPAEQPAPAAVEAPAAAVAEEPVVAVVEEPVVVTQPPLEATVPVAAPKPAKTPKPTQAQSAQGVAQEATLPTAVPAGDGSSTAGSALPVWALAIFVAGAVSATASGRRLLAARKEGIHSF